MTRAVSPTWTSTWPQHTGWAGSSTASEWAIVLRFTSADTGPFTSKYHPDNPPESSTLAGYVQSGDGSSTASSWTNLVNNTGGEFRAANDALQILWLRQINGATSNLFRMLTRVVLGFDTSDITDTDEIVSASLKFVPTNRVTTGGDLELVVAAAPSGPASDTALVSTDWGNFTGLTRVDTESPVLKFSDLTLDAENSFDLAPSAVKKDGKTWLVVMFKADLDDAAPTYQYPGATSRVQIHSSNAIVQAAGQPTIPFLEVVHQSGAGGAATKSYFYLLHH